MHFVVVAAPVPVLLVVCHHVEEAAAWGVGVAGDHVAPLPLSQFSTATATATATVEWLLHLHRSCWLLVCVW